MAKKNKSSNDALANNRKARHEYSILETYEAGMELTGTEIKSVRSARITIGDGFVSIKNDEAFLMNVNIAEFTAGNRFNHDPLRSRKLLLHKKEIGKLQAAIAQKGMTIVPLKVYIKHGFAKVLIGVAQGKHAYDKREALKKRDQQRDIDRALSQRY